MAKLRFSFQIYDLDKDGYISNNDLYQVMHLIPNFMPSTKSSVCLDWCATQLLGVTMN